MSVIPIRSYRATLLGLADAHGGRAHVATVRFPSDADVPRVLLLDAEPFVLVSRQDSNGRLLYAQERPLRIDPGMIEGDGA